MTNEPNAPLMDEEIAAIDEAARDFSDYDEGAGGSTYFQLAVSPDDVRRFVAELRRLRAENEAFKRNLIAVSEYEASRAVKGNKPAEEPTNSHTESERPPFRVGQRVRFKDSVYGILKIYAISGEYAHFYDDNETGNVGFGRARLADLEAVED